MACDSTAIADSRSSWLLVQRDFGGESEAWGGAENDCSRNWQIRSWDAEMAFWSALIFFLHSAAPELSSTAIAASIISSSFCWHFDFEAPNQALSGSAPEFTWS